MARDYELRIVGPITTVNLHSTPYTIMSWAPAHSSMEVAAIPSTRDGEAVRSVRWRNVTEQIQVKIEDGSMANNLGELEHLLHFFERARQQQADPSLDEAVSLQFKSTSSGLNFNAEIISGRAIPHPESLAFRWEHDILILNLIILRRPYWIDTSGTALPLTNVYGSTQTTPLQFDNHDDASHDNHAFVSKGDYPGGMLMPVTVKIKNIDGPPAIGDIFLGVQQRSGFGMVTLREAEDMTLAGVSSSQVDGTASGGDFVRSTWSVDAETLLFHDDITSGEISEAAGQRFKMLARFHNAPGASAPLLRWKFKYQGNVLWEGPQIQVDATDLIQEIGTVKIPPWPLPAALAVNVKLELHGQVVGGTTLDTDFIQWMPLDGYRRYKSIGNGLLDDEILNDFQALPYNPELYVDTDPGSVGKYVALGKPLWIQPDRATKFILLFMTTTGLAPVDHSVLFNAVAHETGLVLPA